MYSYKIAYNVLKKDDEIMDVLQDAWFKIGGTLDKIQDDSSAKAWISTIVRNTAKNALKKRLSETNGLLI